MDQLILTINIPTNILLPVQRSCFFVTVLLPAESGGCFLRVSEHHRQAHNLKVVGSNPIPATNTYKNSYTAIRLDGCYYVGQFLVVWQANRAQQKA